MWQGSKDAGSAPYRAAESVRWLRLLAVLSICVPLFIYLVVGAVQYLSSREDASARASRSLRVAHEHASKVMAASEALQDKVLLLVNGRSAQTLRQDALALHEALRARTIDQPQIQSILILDAEGNTLVSSRLFPFPVRDFSDGEYFTVHRQGLKDAYLSKPTVTRTSKERILNLSLPFNDDAGQFGGVINVTLLTSYFDAFYSDLVADEPGLAVSLFHESGDIYARWPMDGTADKLAADDPVIQRVRQGEDFAQLRGYSSLTNEDSYMAVRKIGRYPLYVDTGVSLTAMRNVVLRGLAAVFAMGALPVAALFAAATIALRNARLALESSESLKKEIETRRRAEEALLQAQKLEALGRLTGGVAHDFNNALMVISNNVHLLKRSVPDVGTKQIESITRAVKSATNLTRQLLAFSRRQPLIAEQVALQDKLPSITDLITPALGSHVQLEVRVHPATPAVTLDLAELELALLNLAINARDAMPKGGSLSIHARPATASETETGGPAMVVIEVRDSGTGIAPDVLAKVFEPFFTTKAVGEGTGLGLSQVYGMCQRLHGRAEIVSEVGAGTCVRLILPCSTSSAPVAPTSAPPLSALAMSLLLVEDNEEVAASLVPILETLGCQVTHVDRADKAKTLLERGERPDLVLSDVVMPGELDGVGLARHIRHAWPWQRLLLMTGYAEQLDHLRTLGFEVLPKPCTPHMLHAAIAKAAARD
ncbi:ATP-binding protein [Acidovorax sp.]|uniref:hybrid sensor histidine kinase/response regulator n=1 Tax=Acidovorax sp. TaxID=1872122 RepID=UPI00391FC923